MFLKNIDLTTASRPSYLPDEVLLFVQDNVGLYEGYGREPASIEYALTKRLQEIQNSELPEWIGLPDLSPDLLR